MFKIVFQVALLLGLEACKADTSAGSTAVSGTSQNFQLQQAVADHVVNAGTADPSLLAQETVVVTITGQTGTLKITKTSDQNTDGLTRTRTLVFDNYTPIKKSNLSNLMGTVIYTVQIPKPTDTQADVLRTVQGTLKGTWTQKDGTTVPFEKIFDTTFKRDPADGCVQIGTEQDPDRCKNKELPKTDAFKAKGELVQTVLKWVKTPTAAPAGLTVTESPTGTFKLLFDNFSPSESKHWSGITGTLVYVVGPPKTIAGEITGTILRGDNRTATVSIKLNVTIERDKAGCPKLSGDFKAGTYKSDGPTEKDSEHCDKTEADPKSGD